MSQPVNKGQMPYSVCPSYRAPPGVQSSEFRVPPNTPCLVPLVISHHATRMVLNRTELRQTNIPRISPLQSAGCAQLPSSVPPPTDAAAAASFFLGSVTSSLVFSSLRRLCAAHSSPAVTTATLRHCNTTTLQHCKKTYLLSCQQEPRPRVYAPSPGILPSLRADAAHAHTQSPAAAAASSYSSSSPPRERSGSSRRGTRTSAAPEVSSQSWPLVESCFIRELRTCKVVFASVASDDSTQKPHGLPSQALRLCPDRRCWPPDFGCTLLSCRLNTSHTSSVPFS
ncbi:hypothetical protein CDEST_11552 [Colletotrichum destructivum]|uniref:Uncharacterized protein n=1 Tax=Colletotrichum destructivum TaxID=34406 RepID=A0AAX4ITR7_9PEZI|nr:hypothetical protein CDEST_11552 [Colletotrichum destructivum]